MKKLFLVLGLIYGLATPAAADTVKIAALVNGEIISNEDLSDQVKIFMINSPVPYNAETKDMIDQRVMVQTVEQKLKSQAATKENITVSDPEVDAQMKSWAQKNKINLSSLDKKGINRQALADNIKAEIAWVKLIRKKYYQTANLTQKEIDETIDEVVKDMSIKKYQVQEIYISRKNAKDIQSLAELLREDPRFDLYAARFSEAPSAANGGNLGWINSGKMLSALEMRLSRMKPGEVSDAFLVGDGYYILKLQQVFDPKKNPNFTPDQKEIKMLLENQKMEAISKKLLQDIKQKAIIEIKK